MSSDNYAIEVRDLAKCYEIYESPGDRLKQFIQPKFAGMIGLNSRQYYREFWALKNINFNVARGETVGIVGKNGSGKSTLLQIICGTLAATSGDVKTTGRIAALLELGSGFNPEFTGRENVFLNASVLGLTRAEIQRKYDEIVGFADIGQFIDQPVKTYSSGMVVRLAFAVQSQIEPEILIVDEALSVGDAKFQAKCFDRLKKLKDDGASILLVTHSTEQVVTHCNRAILLSDGVVLEEGAPRKVVNRYLDVLFGRNTVKEKQSSETEEKNKPESVMEAPQLKGASNLKLDVDCFYQRIGYNHHEYRWGDGSASILDFEMWADDAIYPAQISTGQKVKLLIALRFDCELVNPILGLTIKTKEGVTVFGTNSESLQWEDFTALGSAGGTAIVEFDFKCALASGDYFISLGLASRIGGEVVPHDRRYDSIHLHILPETRFHGLVDLNLSAKVL